MLTLLCALLGTAGCREPEWTTPVKDLDRIVLSIWATTPDDIYVAGGALGGPQGSLAMRYDGEEWRDMKAPTSATLWWVSGRTPRDIWFAGEQGTILRWIGAGFETYQSGTTETLYGIWGAEHDDAWAVGGLPDRSSVALHFDGKRWSPAAGLPDNGGAWFKVWGSAADDVFIVGQYGAIYHYDGANWTRMESGVGPNVSLLTVAGNAAHDVYAVGGQGVAAAVRWGGRAWAPIPGLSLEDTSGLAGVSVNAVGEVSMSGLAGAKLRGRGLTWIDDSRQGPQADFHATWIFDPEDIYVVGGNLNAPPGVPREGVIAHYSR